MSKGIFSIIKAFMYVHEVSDCVLNRLYEQLLIIIIEETHMYVTSGDLQGKKKHTSSEFKLSSQHADTSIHIKDFASTKHH